VRREEDADGPDPCLAPQALSAFRLRRPVASAQAAGPAGTEPSPGLPTHRQGLKPNLRFASRVRANLAHLRNFSALVFGNMEWPGRTGSRRYARAQPPTMGPTECRPWVLGGSHDGY